MHPCRAGVPVPRAPYRRPLVSGGTEDAYQCSRTPSSFSGNQYLFQGEGLPKYSDPDRHYDCQGIRKPLREHPLANIELHSNLAVEMVPGSPGLPDSRIPPRGGEQDWGQGVQGGKGLLRLDDPSSTSLPSDKHEMGPFGGGHVCLQANPSGSEIFQLGAGPSSRSSQCLQPGLEPVYRVCEPSMVSNVVSISKDSQRQCQGHFGSSSMVNTTVVPSDTSTTVRCSMFTSQQRRSGDFPITKGVHHANRGTPTSRLAICQATVPVRRSFNRCF